MVMEETDARPEGNSFQLGRQGRPEQLHKLDHCPCIKRSSSATIKTRHSRMNLNCRISEDPPVESATILAPPPPSLVVSQLGCLNLDWFSPAERSKLFVKQPRNGPFVGVCGSWTGEQSNKETHQKMETKRRNQFPGSEDTNHLGLLSWICP